MYLQSLLAIRHFIDLRSFSIGFALPMLASSSIAWWWKYFRKWCQRTKLLGLGGGVASLFGKTNSWHYARQAFDILEQVQELTRVSIPVLLVTSVLALHLPSFIIGPIVYILRKVITILVPSNYLLVRWSVILFMSVPHLVDLLVKVQTEPEFYLEIFLSSLSYLERHDLPFPIGYQEHLPYLEDRVKELRTRADAVRAFSNVSELIQRSTQHTSHPIEQLVNVLSTICPSPLKYLGGSTLRDTLVVKTDGVPIRLMQVMDDYSNLLIGWTVQSILHDSGHGEWVEIVVKNTSLTKDHIDFTNLLDAPIGTVSVVHSPLSVEIPRVSEGDSVIASSSKSIPPKSKKIK